MGYTPHILVIGGGVTGTGLARDLAMRGLEVTLVERGKLTDGATGRMQGLLYSGARYAVADSETARDCLTENRTLRTIAGHCIEETGGLVAALDSTGAKHLDRVRDACEAIEMDVADVSGDRAQRLEPALASSVERALRVPDATVDPFRLTVATAKAAQSYGATVETHTPVTDVLVEDGIVAGVEVAGDDGRTELDADYVVNATGAWAGELAALAGLDVPLEFRKGAMAVANESPTERVLTRCRPGGTDTSLVPYGGHSLLGASEEIVDDPDDVTEGSAAVDALVDDLASLTPELRSARVIRTYCGVRSRYSPQDGAAAFAVLDHEERDDIWGLTTVVGGTLTTHRLVAERVADHVCAKFGIDRECLTATEALPGSEDGIDVDDSTGAFGLESPVVRASSDRLGSRTGEVLATSEPNPVLCDCELVTRAEVRDAMDDATAEQTDLDEIRIRTRASTGPCQGGRCCHALAPELYPIHDIETIDRALDDLVAERWAGQRHALWGEQLAQAMRNYERHVGVLNRGAEHRDVDLAAFDSGPDWADRDVSPRGGGFQP